CRNCGRDNPWPELSLTRPWNSPFRSLSQHEALEVDHLAEDLAAERVRMHHAVHADAQTALQTADHRPELIAAGAVRLALQRRAVPAEKVGQALPDGVELSVGGVRLRLGELDVEHRLVAGGVGDDERDVVA